MQHHFSTLLIRTSKILVRPDVLIFLMLSLKHLYLLTPKITPYVKDIGDKGYFNMLTKSMKLNTLMKHLITSQKITLTNGKDLTVSFKIGLSLFLRHQFLFLLRFCLAFSRHSHNCYI